MSAECRVGFVGAGGIAGRHLGVLAQDRRVVVAAVADPAIERAEARAAEQGGRGFVDWRAMLDAVALDALWICVPPFAHGAIERAAIARGLPFFVEKPLSASLAVAEEIGTAVEAAGLTTAVGYHWRYLDTVAEARERLAKRPARLALGYWLDSTPPVDWWGVQAQSGGQFVEQATHIFDLARYLVGEARVTGQAAGHLPRADHPALDIADASVATLAFEGGAVGMVAATCLLGWRHRVELQLYGEGIAIELAEEGIMIDSGHGRPHRRAEGDPFVGEDRDFIDAVLGGPNRIRTDYAEALRTHRLVVAATGERAR